VDDRPDDRAVRGGSALCGKPVARLPHFLLIFTFSGHL
jgi:hypothetical protein